MKHAIVLTLILGLAGCAGLVKNPVAAPKPVITPGMKAAKQALDAGTYALAARLYAAQVEAELLEPTPSWVQLSFLYGSLGFALHNAAQYDKALENHRKALAIQLKQLGPGHTDVATSYNNIGGVHKAKGEYAKALENYRKALAIWLKLLGPGHPSVATSYNNMALVYYAKKDLAKAKEYMGKAYAIFLKKLGPNHPDTKNAKAALDFLNK
jgi:tetratricopeptide (TPR) repeat protein